MEESEIKTRVFKAFQNGEALSMGELEEKTQQSKIWLKPLLDKYCDYFSSGEKKAKFQLKPQFTTAPPPNQSDNPPSIQSVTDSNQALNPNNSN